MPALQWYVSIRKIPISGCIIVKEMQVALLFSMNQRSRLSLSSLALNDVLIILIKHGGRGNYWCTSSTTYFCIRANEEPFGKAFASVLLHDKYEIIVYICLYDVIRHCYYYYETQNMFFVGHPSCRETISPWKLPKWFFQEFHNLSPIVCNIGIATVD